MNQPTATTTDVPRCNCGCGAAVTGWSNAGRDRGLRHGVRRVHAATHGSCGYCGGHLDQYRECAECDDDFAAVGNWVG
jgi:hypothetical protein